MTPPAGLGRAGAARRCRTPALVALLRAFGEPAGVLGATRAQCSARRARRRRRAASGARAPTTRSRARTRGSRSPGHDSSPGTTRTIRRRCSSSVIAPPVLYFVGRAELLNAPALAIVGSRSATAQGKDNARAFARALSRGRARRSSRASRSASTAPRTKARSKARGSTLAVVGTGLDRVYPARHRALAHAIAARGGLALRVPARARRRAN